MKALAAAQQDREIDVAGFSGLGIPLLVDGVQADAMMLPRDDRSVFA